MTYDQILSKMLKELGLTQMEFSRLAGIDQSTLSNYVRGRQPPSTYHCLLLAGMAPNENYRTAILNIRVPAEHRPLIAKGIGNAKTDLTSFPVEYQEKIATIVNFVLHAERERSDTVLDLIQTWASRRVPPARATRGKSA